MDRYPIPHPAVLKKIITKKLPSAPLTAMVHITESCNVRCEFCWHHSYLRKDQLRPQHMETSTVLNMIKELADMGTSDITLSANGEPTLHPGFPAMVKAIKSAGMKLKVITNLSHFSPSVAAALARTNLLVINLAAVDQESYRSIYEPRGKTTFSQIIKNINRLSKLQSHGGPEIKIGFVITKSTFRNIRALIKIAEDCRVSAIRFKFMDPSSFTKSLVIDPSDRLWLADEIAKILRIQSSVRHNLADIFREAQPSERELAGAQPSTIHGRCFIGWIVININENGNVTLCCQNDELVIGNWKENSLKEIWEGNKAQEYRSTLKTRIDFNNPLYHACRSCHYSNPKHYLRRNNQA
ncbi:MAG: radical SAM protein [Candidatus Omnitrophica bacterium]|nr:radical SAM protein [Candidatus Omnitrophota bacterium]